MDDIELFSLLFLLIAVLVPFLIYVRKCIRFYRIQSYFIYNPYFGLDIKSRNKTIEHEEITYQTTDGITIFAWYVPFIPKVNQAADNSKTPDELKEPISPEFQEKSRGVILLCHGNAGNVSQRIDSFEIFRELGFSTFIFDYRGYGKSEGKPTEKGTYRDAEGAWNYLVREKKVKPEEIIVFGRSLGGGIASYLAKKYQPRALIIESSFTSITDMARAMVPIYSRFLLRFKYNTRERLRDIHCPVLIIHSPDDRTIPFVCGEVLYREANPPKKFLRIKGDHLYGFIKSKKKYIKGLREFFDELPEPFLTAETVEENGEGILTDTQ